MGWVFNSLTNFKEGVEGVGKEEWGMEEAVGGSTRVVVDGVCRESVGEQEREGARTGGAAKGVHKGEDWLDSGKEDELNWAKGKEI